MDEVGDMHEVGTHEADDMNEINGAHEVDDVDEIMNLDVA
jgi:hypothetical protein